MDNDYYVLTLAAIARELRREKITTAKVFIAAGLPLSWVGHQKQAFKKYLLQNRMVNFTFRKVDYQIEIIGADVYPQGYAAIVEHMEQFNGSHMICDIGNGIAFFIIRVDVFSISQQFPLPVFRHIVKYFGKPQELNAFFVLRFDKISKGNVKKVCQHFKRTDARVFFSG